MAASATAGISPRAVRAVSFAICSSGTSWVRASSTAAPRVSAPQTALKRALNTLMVTSLETKTGIRRGTKLNQLEIDPELNSAPMELPAIMNVASATR